jgi:hypothetical protein
MKGEIREWKRLRAWTKLAAAVSLEGRLLPAMITGLAALATFCDQRSFWSTRLKYHDEDDDVDWRTVLGADDRGTFGVLLDLLHLADAGIVHQDKGL